MKVDESMKECSHCGKKVVARRNGTNHMMHFLLTLLTAGIWTIIWFMSCIKFGGWTCSECGKAI